MERTTKTQIEAKVEHLRKYYRVDIAIDWTMGRPRIVSKDESRNISPRLSKSEMNLWLGGYWEGLEAKKIEIQVTH